MIGEAKRCTSFTPLCQRCRAELRATGVVLPRRPHHRIFAAPARPTEGAALPRPISTAPTWWDWSEPAPTAPTDPHRLDAGGDGTGCD